ncbi:hypothetical protein [Methylobacterium sp. Leaf94]|uniref:hypothetical protein n=1 Tax=Methylobacterium sp. Leaf94 TaxID=1736250 RepID=UPI0012E38C9B|nr:hypothetical protein [Methylobacterium sp. Leaf94]
MAVKSHKVWRVISFLSLLALVGFVAWLFLPGVACPVPDNLFTDEQLKLIKSPKVLERLPRPNCFEFWFNRYQTLLGVFAALGAGLLAWKGAQRQVAAANQQRSVSLIPIVNGRLEATRSLKRAADSIKRMNDQFDFIIPDVSASAYRTASIEGGVDKQRSFDKDFSPAAESYQTLVDLFQDRISNFRANIQPALLRNDARQSVEDFMLVIRPISRSYRIFGKRVQAAIDTGDWDRYDQISEVILKQANKTKNTIDLKQHPVHAALDESIVSLEILLDQILDAGHRI